MDLIAPMEPARLHRLAEQALRAQARAGTYDLHAALTPPDCTCAARVLMHQHGVLCGLDAAAAVFDTLDPALDFEPLAWDGAPVGDIPSVVAEIRGPAAGLLAGLATALGLIGRLSGIATHTHRYVRAVRDTQARILDIHTAAGTLESYAIECAGGHTRLATQADPVLITSAHIQLAGGIASAIRRARSQLASELPIQVEVDTVDAAKHAFAADADALLLRDMPLEDVRWIVTHAPAHIWIHVIGHLTPATVESVALTGVHAITPYDLTGSAPTLETTVELL